jgi:DNA invertase Pin-like site-specific DNA recombinase
MGMTQRGQLDPTDEARLTAAKAEYDRAIQAIEDYRAVVVEMIEKASYREVARLTGLSTNTLTRWKRDADR